MKVIFSLLLLALCTQLSAQEHASIGIFPPFKKPAKNIRQSAVQKIINSASPDEIQPFVNGFSRITQNQKFGFISLSGKLLTPIEFDEARNFVHGLAAVRKGPLWGFINTRGKTVIPYRYEIAFDFRETVTGVYDGKDWFLINTSGEIISRPAISIFFGFDHGIAKIEKMGRKGTMNTAGEIFLDGSVVKNQSQKKSSALVLSTDFPASAVSCPDNLNFESGSFLNWTCFTGRVDSVGNTNVITVTPSGPVAGRHTIISKRTPAALDRYGLFPLNPPDSSNYAVKLGNTNTNAQAERIQYRVQVPASDSNFSLTYDYAVVLQNPGHTPWTQPRFNAKLYDSASGSYVSCSSFEYVATADLPGFAVSAIDTTVIYKPWSRVFISLRGYAGKTLFLEFTTADCVRNAHWGYAYVDVESNCGIPEVTQEYGCANPGRTTLTVAPGFRTYNWWNNNFSSLLDSDEQFVVNPNTIANTKIWLEMIPYQDYGCRDTLSVTVSGKVSTKINSSDTTALCAPSSVSFFNSSLPAQSAQWDFGDGSNATGDSVVHLFPNSGSYLIKLNIVQQGGCSVDSLPVALAQQTVPLFQPIGALCQFTVPPLLPEISTNAIQGTWSPAKIRTDSAGTFSYLFTPLPGNCLSAATLQVTVNPLLKPAFDSIAPICANASAPALSPSSKNGINGNWQPAAVEVGTPGVFTYRFTPAAGVCASPDSLQIQVSALMNSYRSATVCPGSLPFAWRNKSLTTAGIYLDTVPGITGCDTVARFELILQPALISAETVSVCASAYTLPNGITVNSSGDYTSTLRTAGGCDSIVTTHLSLLSTPLLQIHTPTPVCFPETINLTDPAVTAGSGEPQVFSYWMDSLGSQAIADPSRMDKSGWYYLHGTGTNGCASTKPVFLTVAQLPNAAFNGDITVCAGTGSDLTGRLTGIPPFTIIYTDGKLIDTLRNILTDTFSLTINPLLNTTYSILSVSDSLCTQSGMDAKVNVTVLHPQPGIRYPEVKTFINVPVQLHARLPGTDYQYAWSPSAGLDLPDISDPVFTGSRNTQFIVSLIAPNGCVTLDTVMVIIRNASDSSSIPNLFVPRSWTPNNDGINDFLFPITINIKQLNYFRIFDRWGQLMFETQILGSGWNGKYRGKDQVMDTYTWTAEAVDFHGNLIRKSGNSLLIR